MNGPTVFGDKRNMQQVVFRLLGPPEICYKDQPVKITRRRSRALLYYLVCTQTPQPRERLLALLCGETDEESARHTFKTLLAEVRALLRSVDPSVEWISSDGDQLRLNPRAPLWLDAEIFEKVTATTSHNLKQALDLYRGDFLDGFFLKDSPGFDNWLRSSRDHFRHLYLTTLRRLAQLYEANKQFEEAINCTQMLLATDPLMEDAYAYLMHLYWVTDNRVEALRQYEHLCTMLAQELAVKPSATTQKLYEQIAQNSQPLLLDSLTPPDFSAREYAYGHQKQQTETHRRVIPSQPLIHTTSVPFVGREQEQAWLQHHLYGPINHSPLLLVHGEAGSGKTRLLQEVLEHLDASWLTLHGTCQEIEQTHRYHAVAEALRQGLANRDLTSLDLPRPWCSQLASLLPDLFASPDMGYGAIEPVIFADALVALFNQLASPEHPLLLLLDDLHWADTATLALLGHLTRHVQHGSVFLLGTFCDALSSEMLATLRRSTQRLAALAELALAPLAESYLSATLL